MISNFFNCYRILYYYYYYYYFYDRTGMLLWIRDLLAELAFWMWKWVKEVLYDESLVLFNSAWYPLLPILLGTIFLDNIHCFSSGYICFILSYYPVVIIFPMHINKWSIPNTCSTSLNVFFWLSLSCVYKTSFFISMTVILYNKVSKNFLPSYVWLGIVS